MIYKWLGKKEHSPKILYDKEAKDKYRFILRHGYKEILFTKAEAESLKYFLDKRLNGKGPG